MDETFITLSINKFLSENNYHVIQCIPPGGQGGLYFKIKGRIIYPDIIAFKNNVLYIGENKEIFNESDEKKMIDLSFEKDIQVNAQKLVDDYFISKSIKSEKVNNIKFFLGYSILSNKRSKKILNILVSSDGSVSF